MATSAQPPFPPTPKPPTTSLLPTYLLTTNTTITHLTRLLSQTRTLDTTLLTVSYTLHLLHALLAKLPSPPATPIPPHQKPFQNFQNPTRLAHFLLVHPALRRLATSLPPLTTLLDTTRTTLRLSGLLNIYTWALSTYTSPPPPHSTTTLTTRILKTLTWAQIISSAAYQVLENAAFLAEQNVLSLRDERKRKAWVWSGRAWCLYVVLELGRLGVEGYTRWGVEKYDGGEKGVSADEDRGAEGKEEEEEEGRKEKAVSTEEQPSTETKMLDEEGEMALQRPERDIQHPQRQLPRQQQDEGWRDWLREVGVNAAYAPMTVHHSLEDGILSEGVLGALGAVVGALSIGRAWRESA